MCLACSTSAADDIVQQQQLGVDDRRGQDGRDSQGGSQVGKTQARKDGLEIQKEVDVHRGKVCRSVGVETA